jgi:hypothetical protein
MYVGHAEQNMMTFSLLICLFSVYRCGNNHRNWLRSIDVVFLQPAIGSIFRACEKGASEPRGGRVSLCGLIGLNICYSNNLLLCVK